MIFHHSAECILLNMNRCNFLENWYTVAHILHDYSCTHLYLQISWYKEWSRQKCGGIFASEPLTFQHHRHTVRWVVLILINKCAEFPDLFCLFLHIVYDLTCNNILISLYMQLLVSNYHLFITLACLFIRFQLKSRWTNAFVSTNQIHACVTAPPIIFLTFIKIWKK